MRLLRLIITPLVLIFLPMMSINLHSEQVISCPSGDTFTCVKLVNGEEVLGTTYRGEGGVKGQMKF